MKTKTFVAIVVLAVILLGLKVVHSQLSPQPFRPFVVTKTMSSPVAGRPLPLVQIYSLAVRDDGSFVRIAHVQNVVPVKDGVYPRHIRHANWNLDHS